MYMDPSNSLGFKRIDEAVGHVIPADILYIIFDYSTDFGRDDCPWYFNPADKWLNGYHRVQEVAVINSRVHKVVPDMPRLKFLECHGRLPDTIPFQQLQILYSYYGSNEPISKCKNLRKLVSYTDTDNLMFVCNMKNLEHLKIVDYNGINILTPLRSCTNLKFLHLEGGYLNGISDANPLSRLQLEYIFINKCMISDLKSLADMKTLRFLHIESMFKLDPEPVKHVPELELI